MRRSILAACVLAVVLGGCGGADNTANTTNTIEPRNTASSPSPEASDDNSGGCSLLTARERRSIAGKGLNIVAPSQAAKDTVECRWVDDLSSPAPTALRVVTTPAQKWVLRLPDQIENTISAGRVEPEYTKRLLAARKRVFEGADKIGDEEACGMFSLLIEANTGNKNVREIVLYEPAEAGGVTAIVQSCSKGVHTLLTYHEIGLAPSKPLADAMVRMVSIAHKRAIALW